MTANPSAATDHPIRDLPPEATAGRNELARRRTAWSARLAACAAGLALCLAGSFAAAQSVCLPSPRLLTIMPMGGQVGTTFEVTISGESLDDLDELRFSHPAITAQAATGEDGRPVANRYVVTIGEDCPPGVHEARVLTRLGVSSSRAFHVGTLTEVVQTSPNTTLESALAVPLDSFCNAVMTQRSVDYYTFEAEAGQRVVVECAARGIDSKLNPVLIIGDDQGNDLLVDRRGGVLDYTIPAAGTYTIKLHDLTFKGGSEYFYRLALREHRGESLPALPSTRSVSAFSWPPAGLPEKPAMAEAEPNDDATKAQRISLPCDLAGSFFPAADVDTFEFVAKKGDVWWIEVASQRLGRPTDPAVVVQHVQPATGGGQPTVTDVAEFSDIPSPVKVSSNGYSYDGPPYNAGSTDVLGKLEIQEDGLHRLQIHDLFGGTRKDPRNVYRLVIRKAQPDFAVVGWALHMNLRNGDRNALSKPIALRGGATMPIEVVVVRRDGFDGEIDLELQNLPEGVTATGLKIPAGQSRGILLITAAADAPRGLTSAEFLGRATIEGEKVTRRGHWASMKWPVRDASQEVPVPRLLADVPVSVGGSERSPITIAPAENKVWEVAAGEKLTIPLVHERRCEFSGASISLDTFGPGFEKQPAFDAPLNADASEAVLDLAALKTPPGDYVIAFYGSAVAKYRYNPDAVLVLQAQLAEAQSEAKQFAAEAMQATQRAEAAAEAERAEAQQAAQQAATRQKEAEARVAEIEKQLKTATSQAQPKDIVDIVVSTPITIRVKPAEQQ